MHLIVVLNKQDASDIAYAVGKRYPEHAIRIQEEECWENKTGVAYLITAEYIGKKRLTQTFANVALAQIPTYAQAWYDGMVHGRQAALIGVKEDIEEMLKAANPDQPIHDKKDNT